MDKVLVLMSTYNGEKFLCEQLDSILNQDGVDVRIVIRDDGSSDNTLNILDGYKEKYSNIKLIKGKNMGPCKSFLYLMSSYNNSEYFALADQDDIWDKDKLISAIHLLKKIPQNQPLLYYSNLKIVDENGAFQRFSHSFPLYKDNKYSCLAETWLTGCTAVYNRNLAELLFKKKPKEFSMHDTYLFMVASLFGKIVYDFEPHICYRQHQNNVVGTSKKRMDIKRIYDNCFHYPNNLRFKNVYHIKKLFDNELDINDKRKLDEMLNYKKSFRNKMIFLFDNEISCLRFINTLRFKLYTILGKV